MPKLRPGNGNTGTAFSHFLKHILVLYVSFSHTDTWTPYAPLRTVSATLSLGRSKPGTTHVCVSMWWPPTDLFLFSQVTAKMQVSSGRGSPVSSSKNMTSFPLLCSKSALTWLNACLHFFCRCHTLSPATPTMVRTPSRHLLLLSKCNRFYPLCGIKHASHEVRSLFNGEHKALLRGK